MRFSFLWSIKRMEPGFFPSYGMFDRRASQPKFQNSGRAVTRVSLLKDSFIGVQHGKFAWFRLSSRRMSTDVLHDQLPSERLSVSV